MEGSRVPLPYRGQMNCHADKANTACGWKEEEEVVVK